MTSALPPDARIAIAGAGSIGRFVGGVLAAGGRTVQFLARESFVTAAVREGLRLTDVDGGDRWLPPDAIAASADPAVLADADVILVTVKSRDTVAIAQTIRAHARADALVASLQNGPRNAETLSLSLPGWDVRAGVVPYNVVQRSPTHMHRATAGAVMLATGPRPGLAALLSVPGLAAEERTNMPAVIWGKVLINLNNAVNALSGLPLRAQLLDPRWRAVMAACLSEGLAALDAAGVVVAAPDKALPNPRAMAFSLRLPTILFAPIVLRRVKVDAQARSSMQDDLIARRPTEIDALQGEIIRLAAEQGRDAPVCQAIVELIREAEAANAGPPMLPPDAIWARARR